MPFFERSAIDDLRVGPIEDTPFNYGTAPGVSTPSFSRQITAAFELENPLGVGGKAFIEQTGTFEQLETRELEAFTTGPGGSITPESFPP